MNRRTRCTLVAFTVALLLAPAAALWAAELSTPPELRQGRQIKSLRLDSLLREPVQNRVVQHWDDGRTCTTIAEMDPGLDLATQVKMKRFWYHWGPWLKNRADGPRDSRHIRYMLLHHLRTDLATPGLRRADFESAPRELWTGREFQAWARAAIAPYDTAPPALWEPCFTHRWHKGAFDAWAKKVDPESGLPRYSMLTRNNRAADYGEFGSNDFHMGTYAFGLPAVERLDILPLRQFLRQLVVAFRRDPESLVGLEPNHEHEIAVDAEGSQGEYQALTPSVDDAWGQLQYVLRHAGSAVHCMQWPKGFDKGFNASMEAALERLVDSDPPRRSVVGGVGQVRSVANGSACYNIVSIGTGPAHTGLLKSVKQDGSWEGSVYVVPFHAHVKVTEVKAAAAGERRWEFGPFKGLDSGCQLELTFQARSARKPGAATIVVSNGATPLDGLQAKFETGSTWKAFRHILRVQLPVFGEPRLALEVEDGTEVRAVRLCREEEQTTKLAFDILEGRRHRGGITFDVFPTK
ncbi:MAG: hypothetical protein ACLQNE_23605 [Thermoguttaceae bacterium]